MSTKDFIASATMELALTYGGAIASGQFPWRRPDNHLHHNPLTGTLYRGRNQLLLGASAYEREYRSPAWVTLAQLHAVGGELLTLPGATGKKTGQRATRIAFFAEVNRNSDADTERNDNSDGDEEQGYVKRRPVNIFLFNLDQTTMGEVYDDAPVSTSQLKPEFQLLADRLQIILLHNDTWLPRYDDVGDAILMRPPERYPSLDAYHTEAIYYIARCLLHRNDWGRAVPTALHSFAADLACSQIEPLLGLPQTQSIVENTMTWATTLISEPKTLEHSFKAASKIVSIVLKALDVSESDINYRHPNAPSKDELDRLIAEARAGREKIAA